MAKKGYMGVKIDETGVGKRGDLGGMGIVAGRLFGSAKADGG